MRAGSTIIEAFFLTRHVCVMFTQSPLLLNSGFVPKQNKQTPLPKKVAVVLEIK
jgi:hypothetical protein